MSFDPVGKNPFLSKSDRSKLIPLDKRNVGEPHPRVTSDDDIDVEFDVDDVIKSGFFLAFRSLRRFRFSSFRFCLSVISKSHIKGITWVSAVDDVVDIDVDVVDVDDDVVDVGDVVDDIFDVVVEMLLAVADNMLFDFSLINLFNLYA